MAASGNMKQRKRGSVDARPREDSIATRSERNVVKKRGYIGWLGPS